MIDSIKFDINTLPVISELTKMKKAAELVEKRTVSDMRRRIPGAVSEGVCKVYAIKKSEVVSIVGYRYGKTGRGRNSGKGSVSTSFSGNTIATLTATFTGRVHSNWLVKPKKRPKATRAIIVNGIRRVVPKPYQITQETFRGRPKAITTKPGYRAFVVTGRNRVFIIKNGEDDPLIKASTSVPQAIKSEEARELWVPILNDKLETRFFYHFERLMTK